MERFAKELDRSGDFNDDDDDGVKSSGFIEQNGFFDFIFLLDKSGSVLSNSDLKLSLQFVKILVEAFDRTHYEVRFSLVTYSKYPELVSDSHINPDGNRTQSNSGLFFRRSELKKLLGNVRRGTYGPTATRRAER